MTAVECSELSSVISDIALELGKRPDIHTMDHVHAEMVKDLPGITKQDIANSIIEASGRKSREVSEMTKKLAALRVEARRVSEPLQKKKLRNQIQDLRTKLTAGPIEKENVPLDQEIDRLTYNRDLARSEVRRKIEDLKPKSVFQRVRAPFDASRAIITSYDLSMPGRQGLPLVASHPVVASRSIANMFRALVSDRAAHRIALETENHQAAPLFHRAGGKLSGTGHVEEAYQSSIVQRIWGIRATGRAATVFLDHLRMNVFDTLTKTLGRNGEVTLEEAKAIAKYINIATGKGDLGHMEGAANALGAVFFAPKNAISRFQYLAGTPLYRGNARTRKLIAQEYARFGIGIAATMAVGAMAGGKLEKDPRSSDFGKIRFGNTRLDPLAGLSQAVVFLSRLASGSTKSTITGKVTPIRGDIPYGKDNTRDVIAKFLWSKTSPLVSTPTDIATGEDVVGEKVTPSTVAKRLVMPMAINDAVEAMQEQGLPKGTALGLMAFFGAGLQTYNKPLSRYSAPDARKNIKEAIESGNTDQARALLKENDLGLPHMTSMIQNADPDYAVKLWALQSPVERKRTQRMVYMKVYNADKLKPDEKKRLLESVK